MIATQKATQRGTDYRAGDRLDEYEHAASRR